MTNRLPRWGTAGALCLAIAIGACTTPEAPSKSQTTPTQTTTSPLSQVQAESLGHAVALDADAMIEGTGYDVSAVIPVGLAGAPMAAGPAVLLGCQPSISPFPPTNSDGDPIPDSVRIDFTGCAFTTRHGAVSLGGTIDFIDPTPDSTDHAIKTVFTGFNQTWTNANGDTTQAFTEDGMREAIGTSSALQFTEANFLTTWRFHQHAASHLKNWASTFTADTAGTITSRRLPSGTWDINGSSTYVRADSTAADTMSLSVSTSPGLHYNRTCTESPRFDSGTLTAVVTKHDSTATVTIDFTACGTFTVTKS